MYILNRYLLRQFLQIFAICFASLTGLYVVIDGFGHLDHFSSFAEKEGNLMGVIAEYYAYHSLSFFDGTFSPTKGSLRAQIRDILGACERAAEATG